MIDEAASRLDGRLQVTASTLVRHFGEWQERAARAPVYVLHHGRPRLVLVGVDLVDRLVEPGAPSAPSDVATAPVLDSFDTPLLLLGPQGAIRWANRSARARFGDQVVAGANAAALSHHDGGMLAAAIRRVLDGAAQERVALVTDRFPERLLEIVVDPLPHGCLLRVEDATAAAEARAAGAERDAALAAIEATGIAAVARVSLRGYLLAPRLGLAAMVRRTAEDLATVRFLALIDPSDRPAIGESLELASGGVAADPRAARLLTGDGETIAITVSFRPMRVSGRVEEVVAALVRTAA